MIQDIAPHVYNNAYDNAKRPTKTSTALYYENRTALVKIEEEQIHFPTFAQLESKEENADCALYETAIYLFSIDSQEYYLVRNVNLEILSSYTMVGLEQFRKSEPQHEAFAGVTGHQLYSWYESHRFCGKCGHKMEKDSKERMVCCPVCGVMEYPKICPAVIVGVTDGDRILLSKYAGRVYKKYALLAGFVEIGETLEETVRREVMEEVGLKVKNIRYYKSQPWSLSDTVLMGFYCELDGEDHIQLDVDELALAQWFKREEIPVEAERDSLTNEMIMHFKNGNRS